jgi:hypothetical protein
MEAQLTFSLLGKDHISLPELFYLKGNAVGEAPTAILFFKKIRTQIRVRKDLNLGGWVVHPLP